LDNGNLRPIFTRFSRYKVGHKIETNSVFEVYERHYRSTLETGQGVEHQLTELKRYAEVYREKIERKA
jgi:hypothetical protein